MLMITPEAMKMFRGALAAADRRAHRKWQEARDAKIKPPKLSADRFESIVNRVVAILKERTFSKFEYEGPCRNGVRIALIDEGWRWAHADAEAQRIVSRGLDRIGAVRPSWREGQPEITYDGLIQRTRCLNCHGKIEDTLDGPGRHKEKFCCATCGQLHYARIARLSGETMSRAEWFARQAAKSARTAEERSRPCEHCGTAFTAKFSQSAYCSNACVTASQRKSYAPRQCLSCGEAFVNRRTDAKYCGRECAKSALNTIEPRDCQQCGTSFRPANGGSQPGKYCSRTCQGLAGRKARPERSCPACSSLFTVRYENDPQTYCSQPCAKLGRQLGRLGIVCEAVT